MTTRKPHKRRLSPASMRYWYATIKPKLREFADYFGFDEKLYDVSIFMMMGFVTQDVRILFNFLTRETADYKGRDHGELYTLINNCATRARRLIWAGDCAISNDAFTNWSDSEFGDITFGLDVMYVAGQLQRRRNCYALNEFDQDSAKAKMVLPKTKQNENHVNKCERCAHIWITAVTPAICERCGTPFWNKPKIDLEQIPINLTTQ